MLTSALELLQQHCLETLPQLLRQEISLDHFQDVTGIQSVTPVASVGGSSAANIHSAELAANAGTELNTANTLIKRDSNGNYSAGTVTAALIGNVAGNVTGNLTGNVTGNLTGSASNNVLRAGDAMTGFLGFADPTASLQAATKNYVDNKFGTGVASFNNRTGVVSLALDDVTDVLNNANFSTGTITATLLGNATTATTAGNFTGSLSGDVTGTQGATSVATVAGSSAANIQCSRTSATPEPN